MLETLEGRDLPSFVGFALLNLSNTITQDTNTMATLNSRLTTAQQKLTTDINGTGGTAALVFASRATISTDYSNAGSIFGQIKSFNADIAGLQSVQQTLAFAALAGDQFDQLIGFSTLFGGNLFGGLFGGTGSTTSMTPAQIFSAANTTINTAQNFGFPTIAAGANT
jgi:hypothetical protein